MFLMYLGGTRRWVPLIMHYQSTSFTKSYVAYLYNTVPRDHDLLTGTGNVGVL